MIVLLKLRYLFRIKQMLIKKTKSERHQIKKFMFIFFRIIMDPSLPVLSEEEKSEVTPPLETVPTPTAAQL
jgi:hypothetical protein